MSLWRDPDNVSHCRILSPDKTEWQLISATLCGWRRCFVADQLWFMTRIREEEEDADWDKWSAGNSMKRSSLGIRSTTQETDKNKVHERRCLNEIEFYSTGKQHIYQNYWCVDCRKATIMRSSTLILDWNLTAWRTSSHTASGSMQSHSQLLCCFFYLVRFGGRAEASVWILLSRIAWCVESNFYFSSVSVQFLKKKLGFGSEWVWFSSVQKNAVRFGLDIIVIYYSQNITPTVTLTSLTTTTTSK